MIRRRAERWLGVAAAVLGSLAAHAAVLGLASALPSDDCGCQSLAPPTPVVEVTRVVKRPEPEPVPNAAPPEPRETPPPQVRKETPRAPKPEPAPAETPSVPEELLAEPPTVGLDRRATTATGSGPAFATGGTRIGKTTTIARSSRSARGPRRKTPSPNRMATRIPGVGIQHTAPKRKRSAPPPYPPVLKSQGIEADVTVRVRIDEDGRVTAVRIVQAAAHREFNAAAKKAALSERFEPARRNGVPAPTSLTFTYRFRMEEP